MWTLLKPYKKLLAAIVTVAAIAAYPVFKAVFADGDLTASDWRAIGLAALGAVFVWWTKNEPAPPVPAPLRPGRLPDDRAEL